MNLGVLKEHLVVNYAGNVIIILPATYFINFRWVVKFMWPLL
jgi:hypothetical protein